MSKSRRVAGLLLASVLVLGACGSDDGDEAAAPEADESVQPSPEDDGDNGGAQFQVARASRFLRNAPPGGDVTDVEVGGSKLEVDSPKSEAPDDRRGPAPQVIGGSVANITLLNPVLGYNLFSVTVDEWALESGAVDAIVAEYHLNKKVVWHGVQQDVSLADAQAKLGSWANYLVNEEGWVLRSTGQVTGTDASMLGVYAFVVEPRSGQKFMLWTNQDFMMTAGGPKALGFYKVLPY